MVLQLLTGALQCLSALFQSIFHLIDYREKRTDYYCLFKETTTTLAVSHKHLV